MVFKPKTATKQGDLEPTVLASGRERERERERDSTAENGEEKLWSSAVSSDAAFLIRYLATKWFRA